VAALLLVERTVCAFKVGQQVCNVIGVKAPDGMIIVLWRLAMLELMDIRMQLKTGER
jgi:hypothetical protein